MIAHLISEPSGDPGRIGIDDDARSLRVLHVISGLFFGGGHRSTAILVRWSRQAESIETQLCTLGEHEGSPLGIQPLVKIV